MNSQRRSLSGSGLCRACVIGVGLWAGSAAGAVFTVPSPECGSISAAMVKAGAGDTVVVKKGTYPGPVFVEDGVVLISETPRGAILDGKGRKDVVSLSGNAEVSGFEIRNGTVGVFSKGLGNRIVGCRIVKNWGAGIVCIGHLPRITDNVIAYNKGSGIQGYRVRATVFPAIEYNTIAYNSNNGIAVGGDSEIGIHNNVVANNERIGIKIAEGDGKIDIRTNSIFGNGTLTAEPSNENYNFDPRFRAARKLDFTLSEDSPCKGRSSEGKDLGTQTVF